MKKLINNNSEDGYVAISIIFILTVIILGIMVTVSQLGIGEGQVSLALSKGEDSLNFVEGCTEDALLKSRASSTFGDPIGTPVPITRPEGTCSITVLSKTGSWTMVATPSATKYTRTVQTVFNRSGTGIILTSWKEL